MTASIANDQLLVVIENFNTSEIIPLVNISSN